MCCDKCSKLIALVVLVLGVLFLLKDFGVWAFWNISWYSAVLVVAVLAMFCTGACPMCKVEAKKKK